MRKHKLAGAVDGAIGGWRLSVDGSRDQAGSDAVMMQIDYRAGWLSTEAGLSPKLAGQVTAQQPLPP